MSVYLDMTPGTSLFSLNMLLTGSTFARYWNIRISQIPCGTTYTGNKNLIEWFCSSSSDVCLICNPGWMFTVVHEFGGHFQFIQLPVFGHSHCSALGQSGLHNLHPNESGLFFSICFVVMSSALLGWWWNYFQRVTVAFATISAIIRLHRRTLFVYPRKRVCTMPTACTIGCKFRVPQTGKARVSCFPAIQWAAWTRSAAMHSRQTQAPHLKPFIVSYLKDKSKIVL